MNDTPSPDPGATPCLTVVMPCFNEIATVATVVQAVLDSPYTAELLVVDDGSTDGTREVLAGMDDPRLRVLLQPWNQGKGAALRRGFAEARSPFVLVQDADLEYDPGEYGDLLQPLLDDKADVVFGSRFLGGRPHRVLYFWHSVGNRLLTIASNMATDLNLTDMETCYKAFRREVLQSFELEEDRFGIEPEITAKVAAGRWRVFEIGISYSGRTYDEGKKIGWKDGVRAVYCIARYSPLVRARRERRERLGVSSDAEPPVLLLHGFATSSARTWGETGWIDLLGDAGREVLAVDLLGHGDAPKPHDPAEYDRLEDLVLEAMPDRPVDAVGFSLGARTVLVLASAHPERFNRIVVAGVGANLFRQDDSSKLLAAAVEDSSDGPGGAGDSSPVTQYFRGQAAEAGNDRIVLAACLRRPHPTAITDEGLARITCPVLVVIGDRDFVGPGEPLVERLPDARLTVLRNVDHFATPKDFGFLDAGLEFLGASIG